MMKPNLTNHLIALTDHLYSTADAHRLPPAATDTLIALKDAVEQLGMAAEGGGVSLGKPLSAPDVALCVSVALSKIREAHAGAGEVAGVPPVAIGEAAKLLHAVVD